MSNKCKHWYYDECRENSCELYKGSACACLDRFHGIGRGSNNDAWSTPLSSEKGNCPRDKSAAYCSTHIALRQGKIPTSSKEQGWTMDNKSESCKHHDYEECRLSTCKFWKGSSSRCVERFHGKKAHANTKKEFSGTLHVAHGNCPRDTLVGIPCVIHKALRSRNIPISSKLLREGWPTMDNKEESLENRMQETIDVTDDTFVVAGSSTVILRIAGNTPKHYSPEDAKALGEALVDAAEYTEMLGGALENLVSSIKAARADDKEADANV